MSVLASEHFKTIVDTIFEKKRTKALRTIYNELTKKNGVEVFSSDDHVVVIEAHHNYEELYVSEWFEPTDFSQRRCLNSVIIPK
jgi:hypothetical protein